MTACRFSSSFESTIMDQVPVCKTLRILVVAVNLSLPVSFEIGQISRIQSSMSVPYFVVMIPVSILGLLRKEVSDSDPCPCEY